MGRARRGALPLSNEWEVFWIGSGNWIVDNLNSALEMWNERLAEIWQLISISPEEFKGGGVWNVIININGALKAVGYALLVLFFVMGVVKTCGSFAEIKKPEVAFKCLIRFILAQAAVTWGMEIMTMLFRVAQGIVSTIMDSSGLSALSATELPSKMVSIIEDVGFLEIDPTLGGDTAGIFVHLGAVPGDDPYGVQPFLQALYGHSHRPDSTGQLRGTALQQHRDGISQKLRCHLLRGLCHRAGLRDFLCLCLDAACADRGQFSRCVPWSGTMWAN